MMSAGSSSLAAIKSVDAEKSSSSGQYSEMKAISLLPLGSARPGMLPVNHQGELIWVSCSIAERIRVRLADRLD